MIALILHKLILVAPSLVGPILMVASGGGEAAAEGGGGHGGGYHLPNIVGAFFDEGSFAVLWVNVIFAFACGIFLSIIAVRVYSKREMIPGKFQNAVEMVVEGLFDFLATILGEKEARVYTPYLGSLFLYILLMNWIGMVPLGHSPSTSLTITLSLALCTFVYAQSVGIKRNGIGGYLHHLAGSPTDVVGWSMVILMFPLHVIGEIAKPISLSLRLFGNISGEDTLIAVFVALGVAAFSFAPVGLPLQLPFYFLGLLLSTIQALVFTLLSSIYILMMLPHEEHAH